MTNGRRLRGTRRNYYVALAAFITFTMVLSALGAFQSTAAWPWREGQLPISVKQVSLQADGGMVHGLVVVESRGVSVAGALVSATLTYPDGHTVSMRSLTSRAGQAAFAQAVNGDGEYRLDVTNVWRLGYRYDAGNNQMSSASATVGGSVTQPPDNGGNEEPSGPDPEPNEPNNPPSGECSVPAGADVWHAPTDHEHGEAPPAWANEFSCETFGHPVIFGGDEQTPNENQLKHHAFIGFNGTSNGNSVYFRVHAQSNPMGRSVPYHSFEAYVLDPAGNVSMIQGWLDYGIFPNDRGYRGANGDPSKRPAIFGASEQVGSEQWYSRPGGNAAAGYAGGSNSEITGTFRSGWYPDTSITFLGATTLFSPDEAAYVHDMEQWPTTGSMGTNRLAGFHWYQSRIPDLMKGQQFYATQFGEVAPGGLSDPICSGTTVAYGKEYQNVCLLQTVSATLNSDVNVNFAHNINCPSCTLPN